MIKQYKLLKKQNNFEITLNYKGVKVKVNFSGGNTYKGVYPKCYERDPFKQRAIEASQMFKDHEIVKERDITEASDKKETVAVQPRKAAVRKAVVVKKVVPASEKKDVPVQQAPAPQPEQAPAPEIQEPADTAAVTEPTPDGPANKEFANLGEAILFIAQNWRVEVKTEKEAREILKAHGINPKIKKG